LRTLDKKIHKQFFPMKMPSSVVARSMDRDAAQESIKAINHLIFHPDYKQSVGLFVLPEVRRKGVGAQVTRYPLMQARGMGYKVGVLQASEMGYSVYRSLGF
jgi:hypothetical protein